MSQALLGSIAFVAQCFLIQSPMNGHGKMTKVIHFNTIVGASCNEFRDYLPLHGASDEDKRDLLPRLVQEFQCLRFPPVGAGILGQNYVIGLRAQSFGKLLGSFNYLRADREMHPLKFLQTALHFCEVTMNKEDVQRRMSAF